MKKIPILILTLNRPLQFIDMIEKIVQKTDPDTYRIIICDNGSTQPKMVEYLKEIEIRHKVIYNGSNMLFEGLNEGLKLVDTDYFIITDPDILINEHIDQRWVRQMVEVMKELTDVPKLGMSLNTKFDKDTELTKRIIACEEYCKGEHFNVKATDQLCWYAPIDTTMCMYRRDTFKFWDDGILRFDHAHGITPLNYITQDEYNTAKYPKLPVRMGGTFTADHLGWYVDSKYMPDLEYYREGADKVVASTLRNMYDLIRIHHGIK